MKTRNSITDKQRNVIAYIENNTGCKFKGTTKKDAIKFIQDHIDESKEKRKEYYAGGDKNDNT